MSDHARSSRTQASTLVSLPSTPPPARTFFDGAPGPFPRRHEGTQGPGHFTVRPCGPHYRAHPLRFCGFAESLKGRTGDTGDTGARVNARRTSRCPSGVSRRPICPIRPICPTASSFGTSQTCRGCRGKWKLGSLEAWRLGFLQRYSIVLVGTSQTCRGCRGNWKLGSLEAWLLCSAISLSPTGALRSLFSGAPTAPLPCRGVGQRPTSSKPPIIQSPSCPLLFFNHSGSPACASTPLICSKSAQSAVPLIVLTAGAGP